ncbi:hypothetical protein ANN_13190 [Periplaneta americana]|uniref:Uncharacterized protein n=1 Tax=Periplaneta americana TaxID=6978 RepID=A0ABQ8TKT3_PERAM|nr:hypothetical protein ANN_13190 [Periplaneta americana]
MSPGSNIESYPAFARIGLRENPGKNLNQITCPDRDSNPGHLVSRPDALTVTPQTISRPRRNSTPLVINLTMILPSEVISLVILQIAALLESRKVFVVHIIGGSGSVCGVGCVSKGGIGESVQGIDDVGVDAGGTRSRKEDLPQLLVTLFAAQSLGTRLGSNKQQRAGQGMVHVSCNGEGLYNIYNGSNIHLHPIKYPAQVGYCNHHQERTSQLSGPRGENGSREILQEDLRRQIRGQTTGTTHEDLSNLGVRGWTRKVIDRTAWQDIVR